MLSRFFETLQRKKQITILHKHPKVILGSIKLGISNHFIIYKNIGKAIFGKNINFRNYIHILVKDEGILEIGDNVFMNNFCSINCLDHISIGENTLFGENVKLYDHNHAHQSIPEFKIFHNEFTKAPIKIGKNCWLGSNVTILKGVNIGDNCIIGAGCTIYKDIPANTTVLNKQELIFKS
ncbi:acyltransferase [Chryseobacterium sp. PTM-20240506]|uniref:acyltransferase n=1 Tax=unclassified Chryseobacterium TaxID=2593645 RepID=UPI001553B2BD|nr:MULTISPECIES: acyltransferase [unclassified Chryseobacterium]MDC8106315.1 acyltransferase [Chryseobacterium sp. B21-037]MDQ1804821.1 acyltransferase [Chryseobacterium sp. CKR4-1]